MYGTQPSFIGVLMMMDLFHGVARDTNSQLQVPGLVPLDELVAVLLAKSTCLSWTRRSAKMDQ